MIKKRVRGFLLTEILVAAMVLGTILMTAATALGVSLDAVSSGKLQNQASFLLQEELEPLLTIRDQGWANISVNGMYYVAPSGSSWTLIPTATGETVGQFIRSVTISDVYRDSNGQITSSGGTLDPSTKNATATISWQGFLPHTLTATVYITRYKDNLTWTQTLKSEFDPGTHNGTFSQLTSGSTTDGEVVLGAGGGGDWCEPDLTIAGEDLPRQGVAKALTAIEGLAFATTGENSSGVSFANITISNAVPPNAQVVGTFDGFKTNDVFGETNYGYIATDTNAKEIVIIDLTQQVSGKYVEIGSFDSSGPTDANSIFVAGSVGYMTAGNILYNFDLSSKSGSRPAIDSDGVTLAGTGNSIVASGNYAYVATSNTSSQLQIIDVSNSSSLTVVGSIDLDAQGAPDVIINGSATRAYVITATSDTQQEFFIINIENKNSPQLVSGGTYNTNGMDPKAIEIVPGGKAIIVGMGAEEYQVLNILNESSPTPCGGMQVDVGINDSASVLESDGDAFSYILTRDADNEFRIIEGGPGGAFATSGTFESSTFDVGATTAFNRFDVTFSEPLLTDITFQVAVADAVGGSCTGVSFTFVGPDGTSGTFFTDDDAIPLSDDGSGFENPGRCFRYRAYLTTSDATRTPTLHDFTVNYSP